MPQSDDYSWSVSEKTALGRDIARLEGTALHETLGEQGRLLKPRVDGQEVSWEQALTTTAERLQAQRSALLGHLECLRELIRRGARRAADSHLHGAAAVERFCAESPSSASGNESL